MLAATMSQAMRSDVFIACAAVCDYRVNQVASQKLKKTGTHGIILELEENPDIVATVKARFPELYTIGFAAETENLIHYAQQKLIAKNLDAIIANDVSQGKVFAKDEIQLTILDRTINSQEINSTSKDNAAQQIISFLAQQLCH
jgi:phosphopantothenoylcysteine decarboxylase/phosphopantothenate--cysteine ligase